MGCDGTDGLGDLGVGGGDVFQEGTALLGSYPGSGGAHFALPRVKFVSRPQEVWEVSEPELEAASLTVPRFELSQG